ncbi:MAG: hypothetical protein V1735_04590 [Nanoarchaeota archaeon]
MKIKRKTLYAIIAFLVVAGGVMALSLVLQPEEPEPVSLDDFAKCLTEKGAKMYGAYWCGHCQNQKTAFGESWQYVTYIECGRGENPACDDAGIEGYPTWIFADGSRQSGELTFPQLAAKTGCAYS